MSEIETKFCGDTAIHGWHNWYCEGDGISEEDLVMVRCDGRAKKFCPDGGSCHHMCGYEGHTGGCFRVIFAGPLSGVYPDNRWPQEVIEKHGDEGHPQSARDVIAAILADTDRIREDLHANRASVAPWAPHEARTLREAVDQAIGAATMRWSGVPGPQRAAISAGLVDWIEQHVEDQDISEETAVRHRDAVITGVKARIEKLARKTESEAEKEGRSNHTLRTIKLIRVQGIRDALTMLEEKP